MKRSLLTAAAATFATAAASVLLATPAHAATPLYSFVVDSGATQVNALGLTVESTATADSSIAGYRDVTKSNTIASAKAGTLLVAGAGETSSTATYNDAGGVTLVAHARTAGVSLLGGLIKIKAIDSTATIVADGTAAPSTSMTTQLVGLTIGGKSYPGTVKPNTGINIPGVASIGLNGQISGATSDSATIMGAGLRVTLLTSRNGASAGAVVNVDPLVAFVQPYDQPDNPGYPLGGAAYGSYVHAAVGNSIRVVSGPTALQWVPTVGTDGETKTASTARLTVPGVVNLGAIQTTVTGVRSDALSQANDTSTVAGVTLFGGLISAKVLGTTSTATATSSGVSLSGGTTLVGLKIAGKAIPIDVAPNTTIHVANLGSVTINEQQATVTDGLEHTYRTIGLHIVLDTARAGLPVGADVEVATTQAQVWH